MAAVTSIDVARLAQVSQSAVSRTFTPGASVSESTRIRVEEAANKLGYRPNAIARTLITRRSRIIGVVMSYLENQFYPVVLEKLCQRLQLDGYHVLLFITDTRQTDVVLAEILQYQVDGLVMASTAMSSALALNKRVAYIAGLKDTSTNQQREQGLRDALAEFGQKVFARAEGNYNFEDAKTATRSLFSVKPGQRPDAVFVSSDHMAIAVMDTLRIELGLGVPQEVSVVGFDDVKQASWGAYQLSTVVQDADAMIEATVGLLMEEMDGANQNRALVLPTRLVLRASSAPRTLLKDQA